MDFLKVSPVSAAKKIIAAWRRGYAFASRKASLDDAVGLRAKRAVYALEDLPEYNRSTVDGYAVNAASTYLASQSTPAPFKLCGEVRIGVMPEFALGEGETCYVPTGGALPAGADCVAMIEYAETFGADGIMISKPQRVRENVMSVGEDVKKGEEILRENERVTYMKAGELAALGVSEIEVTEPVKVAVISTGDELVKIDAKTQFGQIRDVNTTINCELCKNAGFEVVSTELVKDDKALLSAALQRAVDKADMVLISGGSSKGAHDYTGELLSEKGKLLLQGLALKPGKPTAIANLHGKLVVGLPGHPMACLLTLKLVVLDALSESFGDGEAPFVYAKASVNFPSSPGRLTVQPVKLNCAADGVEATPLFYKSGFVSVLGHADGYILIPEKTEGIYCGQAVKVYLL